MDPLKHRFATAARWISAQCGSVYAFVLAFAVIIVWLVTGPLFDFSDTWQLWINTGTTIVTFLMVFVIQNSQNRDTLALQLKLDEVVRALPQARNEVAGAEELPEDEMRRLREPARPEEKRAG